MGRLGDDRDAALDAPAQEDLGGASPETVSDARDHRVAQLRAGAQRAVGLERDTPFVAGFEERLAIRRRVELHLVDHRSDGRAGDDLIELVGVEVRDADRPGVAARAGGLHPGPRPGGPASRPVDEVEVDVVDPEPLDAVGGLSERVAPAGVELRRDEHLVARDAALAQRSADARLVSVRLRGVDVAVPQLQGRADRVHARGSVRYLPHAESEQRHHRPVGEDPAAPVGRQLMSGRTAESDPCPRRPRRAPRGPPRRCRPGCWRVPRCPSRPPATR